MHCWYHRWGSWGRGNRWSWRVPCWVVVVAAAVGCRSLVGKIVVGVGIGRTGRSRTV